MDIVLVPGLWLNGASWGRVVPHLEAAGHPAHPITLPGMESSGADRSRVTLADCVDAVAAAIDACEPGILLVGHSAGCGIAHGALDRRPDRVARVIHVGGFPTPHGQTIVQGFPSDGGDIPLPPWEAFDESDLAGLDVAELEEFRHSAVPSPAALLTDPQQLSDDGRHATPATVVCTEFSAVHLVDWIEQDLAPVRELAALPHVEYVDLPTGHWPQLSRPADLARIIVERADPPYVDDHGRLHPSPVGPEHTTALAFLEYQRATLAWKTSGLDAAGLTTRVAASSLTLGGLLKHMAWVEDFWFSRWLHDRDPSPPWDSVDWEADPDWEFTSSAADLPDELRRLWRTSVRRSQALIAAAVADGGLDQPSKRATETGERVSLRWIVLHMIEEYARHNGHADLLREAVDGATGE